MAIDDFKLALDANDAEGSSGHFLSIVCSNGGLRESPLIHLANIVKNSLAAKISVLNETNADNEEQRLERFVLQCLMRIPVHFCSLVANKVSENQLFCLICIC